MSCLRRIAGVTRRGKIRNKEVCDRVGLLQDAAYRIQQRRMQYIGHVQRMDHTRSETGTPRICAWDKKTRKTQEKMNWHYQLRQRAHNRQLHKHTGRLIDCNFITRILYRDSYWFFTLTLNSIHNVLYFSVTYCYNLRSDKLLLIKNMCVRDLNIHQAAEMTQHRSAWRSLVKP